jgi:hypothetical protein
VTAGAGRGGATAVGAGAGGGGGRLLGKRERRGMSPRGLIAAHKTLIPVGQSTGPTEIS